MKVGNLLANSFWQAVAPTNLEVYVYSQCKRAVTMHIVHIMTDM